MACSAGRGFTHASDHWRVALELDVKTVRRGVVVGGRGEVRGVGSWGVQTTVQSVALRLSLPRYS